MNALIYDLLVLLSGALLANAVCRYIRTSTLLGYLLVGVVLGRGGLDWVVDEHHEIAHLAEAGVFFLLFAIGIEFSFDDIRRLGRNMLVGGGLQMLCVTLPIVGLLAMFDMQWPTIVLLGCAFAFSSTVLVFKTLSEWGQSNQPHGRRAIAILLFQDAALVPLLLVIPMITGEQSDRSVARYVWLVVTSGAFVFGTALLRHALGKHLIPRFSGYRSPDLVLLFALVVLGGIAWIAYALGMPPAIGAFSAGIVFGGNRWSHQVDSLLLPFREVFAAIFFVSLGLMFDRDLVLAEPLTLLGCLGGLILLKAVAAVVALRSTGLSWSHAAAMSVGLAHVGEFAFVLALQGLNAGILPEAIYRRVVVLAIGSLILTPVLLRYGLKWIVIADEAEELSESHQSRHDGNSALVAGAGPIGDRALKYLQSRGYDVWLIDICPLNLHAFAQSGWHTVAGDASSPNTLRRAGMETATVFVVALPDDEAAMKTVESARALNASCKIVVRCRYQANVRAFKKLGAMLVVSEEVQAGDAILREMQKWEQPNALAP